MKYCSIMDAILQPRQNMKSIILKSVTVENISKQNDDFVTNTRDISSYGTRYVKSNNTIIMKQAV